MMSKNRFTPKFHVKKGDRVEVIAGADKGTQGEVLEVFTAKSKIIVDGVNIRKKHNKATQEAAGGINEINAPIHVSNVLLVDPKTGSGVRVGRKNVDGKNVRFSKKSGEIIG
jgi:large subunit ribosomal protein L24